MNEDPVWVQNSPIKRLQEKLPPSTVPPMTILRQHLHLRSFETLPDEVLEKIIFKCTVEDVLRLACVSGSWFKAMPYTSTD